MLARDAMDFDFCALVKADHDDHERALSAMVDPATPPDELSNLLDTLQLALAIHGTAEAKVLDLLRSSVRHPRDLGLAVAEARLEHVAQRSGTHELTRIRPGSLGWYERALVFRVRMDEHARRTEETLRKLRDYIPVDVQRRLAGEYATERMRMLATTSPLLVADRRYGVLWS